MSVNAIVMPNGMELKVKEGSKLSSVLAAKKLNDVNGDGKLAIDDMPPGYRVRDGWEEAVRQSDVSIFYSAVTNALVESGELNGKNVRAFYDLYMAYDRSKYLKAFSDEIKKTSVASWWQKNFGTAIKVDPQVWEYAKSVLNYLGAENEDHYHGTDSDFFDNIFHSLAVFSGLEEDYARVGTSCNAVTGIIFNPNSEDIPEIVRQPLSEIVENYTKGFENLYSLTNGAFGNVYFSHGDTTMFLALRPVVVNRGGKAELIMTELCNTGG